MLRPSSGGVFFLSQHSAGLTNQVLVRDSQAGFLLNPGTYVNVFSNLGYLTLCHHFVQLAPNCRHISSPYFPLPFTARHVASCTLYASTFAFSDFLPLFFHTSNQPFFGHSTFKTLYFYSFSSM